MAPPSLLIIQINLHYGKDATAILQKGLAAVHTSISLVEEPWMVNGTIRGLGGLLCFRDAASTRPIECIVAKGINVVPQWELCTGDLMVVTTELDGVGRVAIASAYSPNVGGVTNVPPTEVARLMNHSRALMMPLLIGCDAKAHHHRWCSTDTNSSGQRLVEYLVTTELDILNVGNTPTFRNAVREDMLDVTLRTSNLTDRIANWRVSDEPSLSDHEQIRFDMVAGTPERLQCKRNSRDTDRVNYSENLAQSLKDFPKAIDDVPTLTLKDEILNAYNNNCQLTKLRPRGQVR